MTSICKVKAYYKEVKEYFNKMVNKKILKYRQCSECATQMSLLLKSVQCIHQRQGLFSFLFLFFIKFVSYRKLNGRTFQKISIPKIPLCIICWNPFTRIVYISSKKYDARYYIKLCTNASIYFLPPSLQSQVI